MTATAHPGAETPVTSATAPADARRKPSSSVVDLWVRRLATVAVAGVAAYASYQHQRDFALAGGADLATARLWPFSVDGLLVLATVGLVKDGRPVRTRARSLLWLAFAAGIVVSLAANIATAPSMAWAPILVAGWPPVALLLAVELLGHRSGPDRDPARDGQPAAETASESGSETDSRPETGTENGGETEKVITLAESRLSRRTAEQVMRAHYEETVAAGLPAPSGAELDEVAGTNNYGRAVLRKWREAGRLDQPSVRVAR